MKTMVETMMRIMMGISVRILFNFYYSQTFGLITYNTNCKTKRKPFFVFIIYIYMLASYLKIV